MAWPPEILFIGYNSTNTTRHMKIIKQKPKESNVGFPSTCCDY